MNGVDFRAPSQSRKAVFLDDAHYQRTQMKVDSERRRREKTWRKMRKNQLLEAKVESENDLKAQAS